MGVVVFEVLRATYTEGTEGVAMGSDVGRAGLRLNRAAPAVGL